MKLQRAEAIDYTIAVTANVKTLTTHTPKVTDGSSQNGLVRMYYTQVQGGQVDKAQMSPT